MLILEQAVLLDFLKVLDAGQNSEDDLEGVPHFKERLLERRPLKTAGMGVGFLIPLDGFCWYGYNVYTLLTTAYIRILQISTLKDIPIKV